MSRGAAFFDLDRTLLPGASGPVISSALREVGVLAEGGVPGEGLLFGLFDLIGETRPSMLLARQGVRFSRGWDAEAVAEAGRRAAARLVEAVQPYAREEMAAHRDAGRLLVIATTSPSDVVEPLGAALGMDAVIATRYGRVDGRYDGTVDGHYVWGRGKLDAVREWADDNDVDLDASWAYSDSWYDQPLLASVGNPVAVNPDPRLAVMATARRWPVRHLDVPSGVPKVAGVEPQQALLAVVRPELVPYARFAFEDLDHIPDRGPVLIAPNHRSYFDVMAVGLALGRRGRPARFLAKRELFDAPVVGQLVRSLGAIPVDRGTGSDTPLRAAAAALDAGEAVVILPQGTIPRGPAFFDPVMRFRPGVARLAAMTGAPVVPLGVWGTEKVWPRSARVPNMWNVLRPPRVEVRAGPPVELRPGADPQDNADRVRDAVAALLPDEARRSREPTAEELARTYPPGVRPDDDGSEPDEVAATGETGTGP